MPAMTLNSVAGRGRKRATAYAGVAEGLSRFAIPGGVENMDRALYLLRGLRFAACMGNAEAIDSLLLEGLHDTFSTKHSAWHTGDLVRWSGVTREAQDAFAARSPAALRRGADAGRFDGEIEPR